MLRLTQGTGPDGQSGGPGFVFQAPEGAQPVWQEFAPVKFRRSPRLSAAVDPNQVEATYKNGVLFVTMSKAELARPRQVQVQLGEPAASKELGTG
jgi:hypothetical protein